MNFIIEPEKEDTTMNEDCTINILKIDNEINMMIENFQNISSSNHEILYNQLENYISYLDEDKLNMIGHQIVSDHSFLELIYQKVNNGQSKISRYQWNWFFYNNYFSDQIDNEKRNIIYQIINLVNKDTISMNHYLNSIDDRIRLRTALNSTIDPNESMKRFYLELSKIQENLSIQVIVDLMTIACKHFTTMFGVFMTTQSQLSSQQRERDISLALIILLDTLTSQEIETVLRDYDFRVNYKREYSDIRFSMKVLKGYPRIERIVHKMNQNGARIP